MIQAKFFNQFERRRTDRNCTSLSIMKELQIPKQLASQRVNIAAILVSKSSWLLKAFKQSIGSLLVTCPASISWSPMQSIFCALIRATGILATQMELYSVKLWILKIESYPPHSRNIPVPGLPSQHWLHLNRDEEQVSTEPRTVKQEVAQQSNCC